MEMTTKHKIKINKLRQIDVSFNDFYTYLRDNELGNWDNINSEDTIKQYIKEMMAKGIHVSHILKAIEETLSEQELYRIWLGNSAETPTPINNKQDLLNGLEIK